MFRPTFYYQSRPVRAAGILLWTRKGNRIMRMFNKCHGRLEDLGGKTDRADKGPIDTAIREACEETNNHIFSPYHTQQECASMLYDHIMDFVDIQYNAKSKYLLYRVQVHPSILDMNMRRFGRTETTEWGVLAHHFQWRWSVPYTNQLHPRLKGLEL